MLESRSRSKLNQYKISTSETEYKIIKLGEYNTAMKSQCSVYNVETSLVIEARKIILPLQKADHPGP